MLLADALFALLLATPVAPSPADWKCGTPEAAATCESIEQQHARLESIANDAATVAKSHPDAALLILAVADHESGFAIDVDKGPCRHGTCDGGHAACMMQIQAGAERRTKLFGDRKLCFTEGLKWLTMSRRACGKLRPEDQFSQYASGTCLGGQKGSRELYAEWKKMKNRYNVIQAADRIAQAKKRAEMARLDEKKP